MPWYGEATTEVTTQSNPGPRGPKPDALQLLQIYLWWFVWSEGQIGQAELPF